MGRTSQWRVHHSSQPGEWKIAPALAAGNCTVVKPASPTPWSILKLAEVIGDILPAGVLNIVNGPGAEIGKALATNKRIAYIDREQYERWRKPTFLIDVSPGDGDTFSVEGLEGMHFVARPGGK